MNSRSWVRSQNPGRSGSPPPKRDDLYQTPKNQRGIARTSPQGVLWNIGQALVLLIAFIRVEKTL
jgi:hypothetical protein